MLTHLCVHHPIPPHQSKIVSYRPVFTSCFYGDLYPVAPSISSYIPCSGVGRFLALEYTIGTAGAWILLRECQGLHVTVDGACGGGGYQPTTPWWPSDIYICAYYCAGRSSHHCTLKTVLLSSCVKLTVMQPKTRRYTSIRHSIDSYTPPVTDIFFH